MNIPGPDQNYSVGSGILFICLAAAFFLAAGCTHYPVNQPLSRYDPDIGYRGKNIDSAARADDLLLMLSFSGGGTRAAAFSYGVLEALRDTAVGPDGNRQRLLDKVDIISAVSGGSFTAAYYGLFGERIFQDFEPRFLKKDVQGDLGKAVFFNPYNWARLFSPYFDRSDLAAEYYDREVFGGATFADLGKQGGPFIGINATDMIHGTRVSFIQDAFDLICSDLSSFPVARACAASSAVPLLLTPITLKNYAGSCGFRMPEPLQASLRNRDLPDRRFDLANNIVPFLDSERKPYLHLVDGGVADNLGLRAVLERVTAQGNVYDTLKAGGLEKIHKVIFIVVNAETEIDTRWDKMGSIPPFGAMVDSYSSIAISRYNVETIALLRESFSRWAEEIRAGRCPAGKIDTAPGACGDIEFYLVEVKFDALPDPADRSYFKRLPTSFTLPPEDVDKLRQAADRIMSNTRDFKRLLRDLEK
ncbi:MAG: patatin-like phospholipase family protein [Deltaproteobacteria bacterium]|nr:patatin-like phospholipase family protein [Deltaproteobacteria bacterium]